MTGSITYPHKPVMVNEVLEFLIHKPDGIYVDATSGSGGHSEAIVRSLSKRGHTICIDRDPDAVKFTSRRFSHVADRVTIVKANYADIDSVLNSIGIMAVDGILLDLGMSSYHIDRSGRGFSFLKNEPLDMRMDPEDDLNAQDVVNDFSAEDLVSILKDYGEESRARAIVRAIVRERKKRRIMTSVELADIVSSAVPPSRRFKGKHPATKTFQAMRIAVNRELYNIKVFLEKVPSLLLPGGRLVVLSYHSLEDRLIKRAMVGWERRCTCPPDFPVCVCGKLPLMTRIQKKGVKPDKEEITVNQRARSAILRAAERTMP